MHELPVMNRILAVAEKHARMNRIQRILKIDLEVGRLSDLEEKWMRRYFDQISKGSIAEGALLSVEWKPVVLACSACGTTFEPELSGDSPSACPECLNTGGTLVSGRGYVIKSMEGI